MAALSPLLSWMYYPHSSWYYKPTNGRRGIKPSADTHKGDGEIVNNQSVVEDIKKILGEVNFYGYEKITWELHDLDYIINKKKVYRLMKEANLLLIGQKISTHGKRKFIECRCINATRPLEYLVMDIKYVYIHQERRFAYLLTIMDVCTRFVLGHVLKNSIKKSDVVLLLDGILNGIKVKGIIIRNDNGSQFLAHNVRDYLSKMEVVQEFTHIASPEENGFIESLFSSLEREFLNRNWFDSLYHARMRLQEYYMIYNYRRKHRSLRRRSPYQYIRAFFPDFSDKHPFVFSASLSRVALDVCKVGGATCLALDKESDENAIFVQSENQDSLLN